MSILEVTSGAIVHEEGRKEGRRAYIEGRDEWYFVGRKTNQ